MRAHVPQEQIVFQATEQSVLLQAILNVVDFDFSATDAVSAPRFSSTSNAIDIMNRIPGYVVEPLRRSER